MLAEAQPVRTPHGHADSEAKVETDDAFLSVRDLVVEYSSESGQVHAVNGVSFDIQKGRTLGLVGETGAGKTTIARAILRILPEDVSEVRGGSIRLDGQELLGLAEHAMRKVRGRKISMIFQDPMTALNPVKRVGDQIAEVVKLHQNVDRKEAEARARSMLETVGIPAGRYEEYPHQFSGGMKQRVVIAMALACDPELLLADEPTTALDVTIQAQVLDTIRKLRDELGTSMVMITHDLGIVAETCDDVAVVYAGQIIESASLEEVFEHPSHPYTKGLFGALPDIHADTDRFSPIGGLPPDPTNLPQGCAFSPRCPLVTEECRQAPVPLLEIRPGHLCRCIHTDEAEGVDR